MSEQETPKDAQEKRDDEHWTERRQRMVKCKAHGLHYDPRLTSGCAKCRKEGRIATPPTEKPQFLPLLLLILAIVVVVYGVFLPGFRNRQAPLEELVPETETAHRLVADEYRDEIERVETSIFENPASELEMMADDARLAFAALAVRLRESPHQIAQQAAREIDAFSSRLPEGSATLASFESIRSDWPGFRHRYFFPASWFHRTTDPGSDRVTLAIYRDLANELMALVEEGSARIEELSTPNYPAEEKQRLREWQSYRLEWRARLESLRTQMPGRPGTEADAEVLLATQRLEQAFSKAESLAEVQLDSGGVSRFDAAFSLSEKAHRSFDDILLR